MKHRIFVLGIGRSGTSAVAGAIARCSYQGKPVYMADLIEPNEGNPKGYYEDRRVVEINKRILQHFHSWVQDLNPLPLDWQQRVVVELPDIVPAIRELLCEYERQPAWCIKDPRMMLLFPLWCDQFSGSVLTCVRVDRDTAGLLNSLEKRSGLKQPEALRLIAKYDEAWHEALHYAPSRPTRYVCVRYEKLLKGKGGYLCRSQTALGTLEPDNAALALFLRRD